MFWSLFLSWNFWKQCLFEQVRQCPIEPPLKSQHSLFSFLLFVNHTFILVIATHKATYIYIHCDYCTAIIMHMMYFPLINMHNKPCWIVWPCMIMWRVLNLLMCFCHRKMVKTYCSSLNIYVWSFAITEQWEFLDQSTVQSNIFTHYSFNMSLLSLKKGLSLIKNPIPLYCNTASLEQWLWSYVCCECVKNPTFIDMNWNIFW